MNQALPEGFLLHGRRPYTVIKPLHSGGFGITYLVEADIMVDHIPLKGRFTIKEFFPAKAGIREANMCVTTAQADRELFDLAKQTFLDEANILHSLNHEAIVPVNEVFQQNNTIYYVMKYLGESSLEQYLYAKGGFLTEEEALALIDEIGDALKYLHSRSILHLDIKPDNIMMCQEGERLYPVLIDFGQAFFPKSKNTVGGYSKGFSPRELKNSDVHPLPAADIYSLSATLCFLLSGQVPEDAFSLTKSKIYRLLPEQLSDHCADAIVRALSGNPADRFRTIDDFLAALHGRSVKKTEAAPAENLSVGGSKKAPINRAGKTDPITRKENTEPVVPEKPIREIPWGILVYLCFVVIGISVLGFLLMNANLDHRGRDSVKVDTAETVVDSLPSKPEQAENDASVVADATVPDKKKSKQTFEVNGLKFNMIRVEGGTFQMGATSEMENPYDWEKPVHSVTLSTYYIGETEVTQALWQAVMGSNPSEFKGGGNLPVENVSWKDCQDFISKLNRLTGMTFSLPTEAQWEYAARGGNKSRHTQYSGSKNINDVAWYYSNSGSKTHPVGQKLANELGLYDMSGNVWEWCSDRYGDYRSGSETNPTGPDSGDYRVLRGGGWNVWAWLCSSSCRSRSGPSNRFSRLGLRLALCR